MAAKLVNNVFQYSETAGTAAYEFTGNVPSFTSFDSQLAVGDVTAYFAKDDTYWEVGLGQRLTGPERLVRIGMIASSTGSMIAWPASGQREVGGSIPAQYLSFLVDTTVAGMLAKTAIGTVVGRTWQNGTYITVANANGLAGNPGIVDTALPTHFLTRTVASSLSAILTLATGFDMRVDHFAGSPSVALWNGPGGEPMHRWRRAGAQDYTTETRQGGAWRRNLTATAADLNNADRLQTLESNSIPFASVAGYYYASAPQLITSGGALTLTHGLTVKPVLVIARLINVNGEHGYSTGDTIELGSGLAAGNGNDARGHIIRTDATNINVRFGSDGTVYDAFNSTTGARVQLDNGNWSVQFLAWR